MIDTKRINADVSVCGQISTDNLSLINALGFKTLICNRPDGEDNSQQLFEIIKKVADRAGLNTLYVPIDSSEPTSAELADLKKAVETAPKPILAYCKTGARSEAAFRALETRSGDEHDAAS